MANHKIDPITHVCPTCKKSFLVGGRGRPGKDQVYCSQKCNAFARTIQPTMKKLTDLQIAYVAGVFDGEGSVILYDRGYGGRPQLRVTISNTYEPLMDRLLGITGTGSVVRHVHPPEKGYKDSLTWQCYGQNGVALLEMMLPYLVIKKDKALHAIQSQKVGE
jgi:hypothetical protein